MSSTTAAGATRTDALREDPLSPVRTALLTAAHEDAERQRRVAEQAAASTVEQARQESAELLRRARAEGEADAEQVRLDQRARARRRARSLVLSAEDAALRRLRTTVHERLAQLWADPHTRAPIREHLEARARSDLGPDVDVKDDPRGGLVARLDHARAYYLLADLADDVIDDLGPRLSGLWTP